MRQIMLSRQVPYRKPGKNSPLTYQTVETPLWHASYGEIALLVNETRAVIDKTVFKTQYHAELTEIMAHPDITPKMKPIQELGLQIELLTEQVNSKSQNAEKLMPVKQKFIDNKFLNEQGDTANEFIISDKPSLMNTLTDIADVENVGATTAFKRVAAAQKAYWFGT